MRYLSKAVDDLDLIYAVYAWTESSVNTEDAIVDDTRQGQIIKHVGKMVPHGCIAVLSTALGVEAIRLCDTSRFMIASDQMDPVRITKFETDEKSDGLDAEKTTIDVVTFGTNLVFVHNYKTLSIMRKEVRACCIPRNR